MTLAQSKFIEKLYFEMYDLLLSYARWALENDALAEEAVQETFQTACMKPMDLLLSPNPHGWLFNTLKFTFKNSERNRNRTLNFLTEYTAAHGKEAFSEDRVSLETTYGSLAQTEEFQLLIEMAVEGKSHLEMAQKRGISVAACKKRVQRAKESLRKKI